LTAGDKSSQDNTVFVANNAGGADGRLFKPGDVVGGYKLKSLLGRGGMGYVFRAEHLIIHRDYALKLLAAEHLTESSRSRFEAEGRAIANLDHANIVKVHNMGLDGGIPFYVMDLLDGASLADCIASSVPVGYSDCLNIFIQIASGLAYAHGKGIVHRDIKPSNIVLITEESVAAPGKRPVPGALLAKIVDFGIAKIAGDVRGGQSQTATGEVFGSPFYMSPEQCMGERVDVRSDIYSLGCTLFETLSGSPPYQGENALQTVLLHQNAPIPALGERFAERGYPEGLDVMIAKMLAKRPGDRYQTMQHVLHDLGRLQAGKNIGFRGLGSGDDEAAMESSGYFAAAPELEAMDILSSKSLRNKLLVGGALALAVSAVAGYLLYPKIAAAPFKHGGKVDEAAAIHVPFATKGERVASAKAEDAAISSFLPPVQTKADIEADRRKLDEAPPIVSHKAIRNGKPVRIFSFPPVKIGYLEISGLNNKNAVGEVAVPDGSQLYLKVKDSETIALDYPDIFKKIGPGELDGIKLVGHSGMKDLNLQTAQIQKTAMASNSNEVIVLKIARDWTKLSIVALDAFVVKPATLDALDDLPHLKRLELVHTIWKAGYPIKLRPYLQKLDSIELADSDCTVQMAATLSGLRNLHYAKISRIILSPKIFYSLAACPELKHIELDKCEVTEPVSRAIASMSHLQKIIISTTVVSTKAAKILADSPNLKIIILNNAYYSAQQQADIKQASAGRIQFRDLREY
jgi:serine/threonine protein kinase